MFCLSWVDLGREVRLEAGFPENRRAQFPFVKVRGQLPWIRSSCLGEEGMIYRHSEPLALKGVMWGGGRGDSPSI